MKNFFKKILEKEDDNIIDINKIHFLLIMNMLYGYAMNNLSHLYIEYEGTPKSKQDLIIKECTQIIIDSLDSYNKTKNPLIKDDIFFTIEILDNLLRKTSNEFERTRTCPSSGSPVICT